MRLTIAASIFALLFFVGQAKAAGQFSLYAGYMNPGDLNLESLQEGFGLRSSGHYGARAEFDFLRYFGIEQNIGFSPRLVRSSLFADQASDVRGFFYSSNFMLNIAYGRFVPYVVAGIGFVKPWGSEFALFDAKLAGDFGGGIKLNRIVGPLGLRFDIRGWRTTDIADQGGAYFLDASGGLTFSWGRK
jgi:hypothetical protein